MSKKYLTTTLPYVNAEPHIGFGWEITEADVIARFWRLQGHEVIFNTGTDEHGQKIYERAVAAGKTPQAYTDEYAAKFSDLQALLNLSYTHFIRTTDAHHVAAAQEFWRRSDANGDIYKKLYKVKYCVGCELEKTESELVNGRCPLHPNAELEIREEENYFFRFSKYQEPLLALYRAQPEFVKPAERMKEIVSFAEHGLQDFSISRLKSKMPWGVPVPGDEDHVMYVWFDALVNYISTLGWPDDAQNFADFWPGVQLAGKDNLRQQSAMWQAMLLSAQLPSSAQILINGFISIDGQKMSKSLGNVITPGDLVRHYGVDGARMLLISLGAFAGDPDVTWDRFNQAYTAYLANGLGNVSSRIAKLAEKAGYAAPESELEFDPQFVEHMDAFDLTAAQELVFSWVAKLDQYLSETTPWFLEGSERAHVIDKAVAKLLKIAFHLQPFMPTTADFLLAHFRAEQIVGLTPMFPRLKEKI